MIGVATATATKEAPAPAEAKTETKAAEVLTDAQKAEALALRQGNPAEGVDGLTFVEIATRLGLKSGALVSKALAGVPAGRAKAKGTVTPHERVPVGTVDWDSAVASVPALAGSTIAWRRATYCMVRADSGRSGVGSGRLIAGTGTPWATLCEHLAVHGASKGATAETAGKERSTWCEKCAAGEPGVVGKRPRTPEQVAADEAKAAKAKVEAKPADGEPAPVAEKAVNPQPKKGGRPSRAARNAEKAAAEKKAREQKAAAATDDPPAAIA